MNDFDFSLYDDTDLTPSEKPTKQATIKKPAAQAQEAFDFDLYEDDSSGPSQHQETSNEGGLSSAFRTLAQIPQGIAEATGPGIATGLWQLAGMEALDPEEIERIREISEREGVPFDEDKYREAAQQALESVPTVGNIARSIEERTGLPLEAKEGYQKALRLGSTAAKFQPGAASQKATAAVAAPAVSQLSQQAGLPEPIADVLGLAAGGIGGELTPKIDIGKAKHPSGLTKRQFEKVSSPKQISEGKHKQINAKVENEFRDIASNIIEKSPIEETHTALKNDSTFKQASSDAFKEVQTLSESIPDKFSTNELKKTIVDNVVKKKGTGFLPTEYEKSHKSFIKKFIKETPNQEITAADLVTQYRKNNKALKEVYEPGQSFAYNKSKRDALLDYNRAIAETIEKQFPDSEFSNLFKSTNETWSKIMDAEAIDKFMDGLFDGKIKFEKGKSLLEKDGMSVPFKRALGEQGYKDFEQLTKDLMSTEQAHKMLKVAKDKGYGDMASTALSYIMHPHLGYAKAGFDIAKAGWKKAVEAVLDKPQLAVTWDKGVKAFKQGKFAEAEKSFATLKGEVENATKAPMKAKPQETIEVKGKRITEPKAIGEAPKRIESPKEVEKPSPPKAKKAASELEGEGAVPKEEQRYSGPPPVKKRETKFQKEFKEILKKSEDGESKAEITVAKRKINEYQRKRTEFRKSKESSKDPKIKHHLEKSIELMDEAILREKKIIISEANKLKKKT